MNFKLLLNCILFSVAKHINFEPIWIAMNGTHVIISSYTSFMTWQYSVPKSHSASITNSKLFIHIPTSRKRTYLKLFILIFSS